MRDAKQNDSKNLEEECKEATRKWKTLNVELKPLGDQVKELFTKAKSGTENVTPDDRGWNKFQQKFDKFPGTLIELSERIKIEQSKMYCMTTASGENVRNKQIFSLIYFIVASVIIIKCYCFSNFRRQTQKR